jgi:formylglycine-generating enzyme required for sulfatase activity
MAMAWEGEKAQRPAMPLGAKPRLQRFSQASLLAAGRRALIGVAVVFATALLVRGLAELALRDEAHKIRGEQQQVLARAPSASGAVIATSDGTIASEMARLRGHDDSVTAVVAMEQSQELLLLSGDKEGNVRLSRHAASAGLETPDEIAAWAESTIWAPLGRPVARWTLTAAAQALPFTIPVEARGKALYSFRDCAECPEMVALSGGLMLRGSPWFEMGRSFDEGPRQVFVVGPVAVGRFEVTFDEWAACVAGGGCRSNVNPADEGWGRGRRPVINVSWNDAQEYVRWLSQSTGQRYRLLTEAEWEYAARAGTTARWSFGDDESQLGTYAWDGSNSNGGTQPVDGKTANRFGLHDVHGNVWEWVEDCYASNYSGLATNGAANTTEGCSNRVGRGGGWDSYALGLRSANRSGITPTLRNIILGFRVARTL